jgi:hypothetical protein
MEAKIDNISCEFENPAHIRQSTPDRKRDRVSTIIRAQLGKDIRDMLLDSRLAQP